MSSVEILGLNRMLRNIVYLSRSEWFGILLHQCCQRNI